MGKIKYLILCMLFTAGMAACGSDNNGNDNGTDPPVSLVGQVLPDWQEGILDIHMINTGRGESILHILPDGTTLLVDAAGSLLASTDEIPPHPGKPNASITSGQVIINYVNHFVRPASKKLDYMMLSHYDTDHMGNYDTSLEYHTEGGFYKTGMTEVGAGVQVDKLIDRGYSYPKDRSGESRIANYIKFSEWSQSARGTVYEEFDVGSNLQVVMKYNPSAYNCEIRNIFGNGYVWTGTGSGQRNTFPESTAEINAAVPDENVFSLTFHLKYGRFDYFSGGDLQYNGRSTYYWKDVEAPVAAVMGEVEVMKANHHGTANCNGTEILNALKPRAILINSWRDVHPRPESIQAMYDVRSDCNIFINNTSSANRERLADYLTRLKSHEGHIVVRVQPDELNSYMIYVLDDTNEDYKVKSEHGPYLSY